MANTMTNNTIYKIHSNPCYNRLDERSRCFIQRYDKSEHGLGWTIGKIVFMGAALECDAMALLLNHGAMTDAEAFDQMATRDLAISVGKAEAANDPASRFSIEDDTDDFFENGGGQLDTFYRAVYDESKGRADAAKIYGQWRSDYYAAADDLFAFMRGKNLTDVETEQQVSMYEYMNDL